MTVYSRTENGNIAAYGEHSLLPRKLKSLLRVIDGKTDLDVYVRNLQAFGDIEKVLLSLEMAGLLQHSSGTAASDLSPGTGADAPAVSNWRKLLGLRSSKTEFMPADETESPVIRPEAFEGFYETLVQNVEITSLPDQHAVVKQATDKMADFVLNNAPEHAFMVLKELEEILSCEQLAVAMDGYAQMINHCGDTGNRHLEEIKQLLRDAL